MLRWLRNLLIGIVAVVLAVVVAAVIFVEGGFADGPLRRLALAEINKTTGGRAEIGALKFRLRGLAVEVDDFTLHGRETGEEQPFFHADKIQVHAKLLSFWSHRVALNSVVIEKPAVFVETDPAGHNNLPVPPPPKKPRRPWQDQLFDLQIGRLELNDGVAVYNNEKVPLNVRANDFQFAMTYDAPLSGKESYVGTLAANQTDIGLKRDAPFTLDMQSRFTLARDDFSLDELQVSTGKTQVQLRAEVAGFSHPKIEYHSRVRLDLHDVAQIFKKPSMPDGLVDWTGSGNYEGGQFNVDGHYDARGLTMRNQWFHAANMESWGRFTATRKDLELPEFQARALGGSLTGRMKLDYQGMRFWTQTSMKGASLSQVLDAVNNPSLPLDTFHWTGTMSLDSINEWNADFKHFHTYGKSTWTPSANAAPGQFPATAQLQYDYNDDKHAAQITNSMISTPNSELTFDGSIGRDDSALETELTAEHLLDWDDFINDIRGPDSTPVKVAGEAHWRGRVLGPITGPNFVGHVSAQQAEYGRLDFDTLTGDLDYSPDALQFNHVHATRRGSEADMNLSLTLDGDWNFLPESPWSLDARLKQTSTDGLQDIFDTSYPVSAVVTGTFEGSGTRANPEFKGDFQAQQVEAKGFHFDEFDGSFTMESGKFCLEQARLALGEGHANGRLCYELAEKSANFRVDGTAIPIAQLIRIENSRFVPAGTVAFHVQGSGPLNAPTGNGDLHVRGLTFGPEKERDIDAVLNSDGKKIQMTLNSTQGASSTAGVLQGDASLMLTGDDELAGNLTLQDLDLDPVIATALHLTELTGHSSADGKITLSGSLRRPESISVVADITRLALSYETVALQNAGPLRISYANQGVHIEQASLHGPNSDFRIGGSVHFVAEKAINIRVDGTVNLHLLRGFVPGLDAEGAADVGAGIQGALGRPEVNGTIRVTDASAEYEDFPTGLSHMNGTFVFDKRQVVFDKITAQSGGGNLVLNGSIAYTERPVRFDINATASSVRVRYPAGMSWTGSAVLRLSGSSDGALLSGNVTADRLLITENAGLAGFFEASPGGASVSTPSSSHFLQNLQFDVLAQTSPGARMEWTGARLDMEGSVRLRGTWDHPVLLGNVHVLSGDLVFNGSKYQVSRGEINLANPFRLDPVLDVEATTTIQQYIITIDFSGPVSHLSLSYRADPPLPQGDIIALLALGSTGEEGALRSATAQQTQNYGATALLSAAISNQLGGRIERLFGITQFRVDPFLAGTTTEQNAAARVTIQQQVTRNLSVTYSTNATSNQQQQVVQMEYALSPRVSIVGLRDINGIYSVSVKITRRLK